MQEGIIGLTIAFQFFLFVGYMFYLLFRSYGEEDSRLSLMSYTAALLALLTSGMVYVVLTTAYVTPASEAIAEFLFVTADLAALVGLACDLGRARKDRVPDQESPLSDTDE
ncbi:MAG: hypothetical protein ACP6KW_12450 [Candidatus Thorarchaeota archaeon]